MERFINIFKHRATVVVGMVHLRALPGTPRSQHTVKELVDIACSETRIYKECGVDAVMVENMHDVPYVPREQVGPEVTAAMAVVCAEVKKVLWPGPVGVQVLAGANRQALAVAQAAGLQFIRAEGFVFAHVGDEGTMEACAGDILRYRRQIGADNILVFTDIKKKHSAHAITADVNIAETAKAAEFFLSDGVVITGTATGMETDPKEVAAVRDAVSIPVLVGSGVTVDNVDLYRHANALIIGSHFKQDGAWQNELDPARIKRFMSKVKELRSNQATMII